MRQAYGMFLAIGICYVCAKEIGSATECRLAAQTTVMATLQQSAGDRVLRFEKRSAPLGDSETVSH
jgi:hypothetical protein